MTRHRSARGTGSSPHDPRVTHRLREGVRAVVMDDASCLLLVCFDLSDGPLWATPGGGVEPGESPHAAIKRELIEEVGMRVAVLGPVIGRAPTCSRSRPTTTASARRSFLFAADDPVNNQASRLTSYEPKGSWQRDGGHRASCGALSACASRRVDCPSSTASSLLTGRRRCRSTSGCSWTGAAVRASSRRWDAAATQAGNPPNPPAFRTP